MPRYSSTSGTQDAGFSESSKNAFEFRRVVVLTKLTHLEYWKERYNTLSPQELEMYLRENGVDIDLLMKCHAIHKRHEENLTNILIKRGVEVQVLNQYEYCEKHASWADVVFSAGGDGTLLLAASRIHDSRIPLVGFNTNPCRSEGVLCLPGQCTNNLEETINKIRTGDFSWQFRSRIRIEMLGKDFLQTTSSSHEQNSFDAPYVYSDMRRVAKFMLPHSSGVRKREPPYGAPYYALNEVFISEKLAAPVTNFDMKIDDSEVWRIKSSGLCVSTGSGSTSWHLNMNRVTEQTIGEVFHILKSDGMVASFVPEDVQRVVQRYNDSLRIPVDDERMTYTIRDMVVASVWPSPGYIPPRGFAKRLEVRSKCLDGLLVVDGSLCFIFNEGAKVILEIQPENNLRTISID